MRLRRTRRSTRSSGTPASATPASPEAPQGVRIITPDLTEYPCDVLLDGVDEDGCHLWQAVPRDPFPWVDLSGWSIKADVLPARTSIRVGPMTGEADER